VARIVSRTVGVRTSPTQPQRSNINNNNNNHSNDNDNNIDMYIEYYIGGGV